jgi:hypothetical protein
MKGRFEKSEVCIMVACRGRGRSEKKMKDRMRELGETDERVK